MNKLLMAADKLKKLEARGRAAFIQGDIIAATRFFAQALDKSSGSECCRSPAESKPQRKISMKSRSLSLLSLNNNNNDDDENQVWILQSSVNSKRNKKTEKKSGGKKDDGQERGCCVEILDGIVADAETAIETCPSYPIGYLRKASALILLNQWEDARKTYTTGLAHCQEKSILRSALLNLNRTHKITSCAENLDLKQLTDLVNENGPRPNNLPSTPSMLRRNKFRLQGQRRLTKKLFPSETETMPQIQTTSFRRRNSSSTDTHL